MSNNKIRKSILSDYGDESPKRLVSAPTLYCIFAFGIILVMVGTFTTAHAYLTHHHSDYHLKVDEVLRILGPILLGCGGLTLFSISITCLCVYKRNKSIRHLLTSDEFCNIGASTFYDQRYALSDTVDLINSSANEQMEKGIDNLSHPTTDDDPITFLTKAVLHERRRKLSKNIVPQVRSLTGFEEEASSKLSPNNASPLRDLKKKKLSLKHSLPLQYSRQRESPGGIELQLLKRATPVESLTQSDDADIENESLQPVSRERFYSMKDQRPQFRKFEDFENLRRIASLTSTARIAHREEQRKRRRINMMNKENENVHYPPELSNSLSLKKKKKRKENKNAAGDFDQPKIHHLSSYSPEVIESLIEMADKQDFSNSLPGDRSLIYPPLQNNNQSQQLTTNQIRNDMNDQNKEVNFNQIVTIRSTISPDKGNGRVSTDLCNTRHYNIDDTPIEMRNKNLSEKRSSGLSSERDSLGVQTLKRNFENMSRHSQVSFVGVVDKPESRNKTRDSRTKSNKDIKNTKLQTSSQINTRNSNEEEEYSSSSSSSPSPPPLCDSSSSGSPPPPSPTKASFTAINIMQDLCCQESAIPQRTQKVLSIISSQDEHYETD